MKPIALSLLFYAAAASAQMAVPMDLVDGRGALAGAGQVSVSETPYGVLFTPALKGLPPGLHGFHVHEKPSCAPLEKDGAMVPALGAGGHYDPQATGRHDAPWGSGHLGDLPPLYADPQGNAVQAVLAPRLKLADLAGRSLMVHVGGDNHADHPAPLGGGGARMACGVIR